MRNTLRTIVLGSAWTLGLAGCGGDAPVEAGPGSSVLHGGVLVPLPESQGFVELLNGSDSSQAKSSDRTIEAYILQSDQKTAATTLPSELKVTLDTPKGKKTVPLKPLPKPGDPVGPARFVSEPGPFELNQKAGEISLNLGGKALTAPFRGPR